MTRPKFKFGEWIKWAVGVVGGVGCTLFFMGSKYGDNIAQIEQNSRKITAYNVEWNNRFEKHCDDQSKSLVKIEESVDKIESVVMSLKADDIAKINANLSSLDTSINIFRQTISELRADIKEMRK